MKILLIYPSKLNSHGKPYKYRKAFLPPLALATLAGLTDRRHQIVTVNDIVEQVDYSAAYDLVCITAFTVQAPRAYQIADRFRALGVQVVIGGMHPTILPEESKQHADAVVIGEAENLWERVLDDAEHHRLRDYYQDIDRPDLKKLVIPNWNAFNFKIYPKQLGAKLPMMPFFITRGCAFSCKFCSVHKYFGRTYRFKPITNVLQEINSIPTKELFFVDDNIICQRDYSRELFQALIPKKVKWFSQMSVTVLREPELISLAAKSGCFAINIGLESIRPSSLQSMNKRFNKVEEYQELFDRLREVGIVPNVNVIFGLDDDTEEGFLETIDFLLKNKIWQVSFAILTPLPGTDLYDEMKSQQRLLSNDWSEYDLNNVVFKPLTFTPQQLSDSFWRHFHYFYQHNRFFIRVLNNAMRVSDPLASLVRFGFYQFHFRKTIAKREHPFSGGLFPVNSNESNEL